MDSDIKSIVNTFSELLVKSEERIDRTNNMIVNGLKMVDQLSREYASHLSALREMRDKLTEENRNLSAVVEKLTVQLSDANSRYDNLLNRFIDVKGQNKSENNFNIK